MNDDHTSTGDYNKLSQFNQFRKWLYSIGACMKKDIKCKKTEETHLLINGGRILLPEEHEKEFLRQYSRSILNNDWLYVVEKKTEVFRMFCELDFKSTVGMETEDIINLAKEIHTNVISRIVSFSSADVCQKLVISYVASVVDKTSTPDKPVFKTGIHPADCRV